MINSFHVEAEEFKPESLIPPQFRFQGNQFGAPPTIEEDCNCDGQEDSTGEKTKKSKRPLIELSLSLAEDRTVPSTASMLDCDTLVRPEMKQIMDDLLNDLAQGTYSTMGEYQSGIEERSSDFNDLEKFVSSHKMLKSFNSITQITSLETGLETTLEPKKLLKVIKTEKVVPLIQQRAFV